MNGKNEISYCIESNHILYKWREMYCVRLTGWVQSNTDEFVQIKISGGIGYRIYRFNREDLIKEGNKNDCLSGFYIDILLEKYDDDWNLDFIVDDEIVSLGSKVSEYKKDYKKMIKKVESQERLTFFDSPSEKTHYCIDSILHMPNHNVLINGWAFSEENSISLLSTSPNFHYKKIKRGDVVDFFSDKKVDVFCGFEIETGFIDDCVGFSIEQQSEKIYMCFSKKVIEQFRKMQESNSSEEQNTKKNLFDDVKNNIKIKRDAVKNKKKYGIEGAKLIEKEYDIFLWENILNQQQYDYEEFNLPDEWIDIQKKNPKTSVIVAVSEYVSEKYIVELVESVKSQKYTNWELVLAGKGVEKFADDRIVVLETNSTDKEELINVGINHATGAYVMIMDQEDFLDSAFLALVLEKINLNDEPDIIVADYDIVLDDEKIIRVNRSEKWFEKENNEMLLNACIYKKCLLQDIKTLNDICAIVRKKSEESYSKIEHIAYHYNAVNDVWNSERKVDLIAFYLTQYHITEENNKWWGEGFTEWTNVKKGTPQFEGHYQPRVPTELGYYDLVEDKTIQYKQIDLAKQYNLGGFCYYYYWFEGKRLIRKPLDQFLENKELDFPFCICWANETWSRRWDGQEHEVLMQQVHNKKTDIDFINDMIPLFKDPRYIKLDGKPLLLIYRIGLFPEPYQTISRWRKICIDKGIGDIHVALVQSFGMVDHRIYGADSSVEFPPHKIVGELVNDKIISEDSEFVGNIYDYGEIVKNLSTISERDYTLYPGSMLAWDNTARRKNSSNIFYGFSIDSFKKWLVKNYYYSLIYNKNKIMFINAWNEWGEGTYLEPDERFGREPLQKIKEVLNLK